MILISYNTNQSLPKVAQVILFSMKFFFVHCNITPRLTRFRLIQISQQHGFRSGTDQRKRAHISVPICVSELLGAASGHFGWLKQLGKTNWDWDTSSLSLVSAVMLEQTWNEPEPSESLFLPQKWNLEPTDPKKTERTSEPGGYVKYTQIDHLLF